MVPFGQCTSTSARHHSHGVGSQVTGVRCSTGHTVTEVCATSPTCCIDEMARIHLWSTVCPVSTSADLGSGTDSLGLVWRARWWGIALFVIMLAVRS